MEDIPTGFLKLPELECIALEPGTPYQHPVAGLLHSSKFKRLLSVVLGNSYEDIGEIINGHVLEDQIRDFTEQQLGDFCRHVLVINRDKIGWQVVDNYLDKIQKEYGIPKWDRPEFKFAGDFNQLFTSIRKWEIDQDLQQLLYKYIEIGQIPYLSVMKVKEKLELNYQFWSYKELFLLFEGLVEQHYYEKQDFETFKPLLQNLREVLLSEAKNYNQPLEKRIALLTIICRSYVKLNFKLAQDLQALVDRLWIEVTNSFKQKEIDSYRYIFAVMYGHIGYIYYQYNIGFVLKRRLQNQIMGTFFRFNQIDIGEWLEHFLHSDVDDLIKEYMLNGYLQIVYLLHEYAKELPSSEELDDAIHLNDILTQSLLNMASNYLILQSNQQELDQRLIHDIAALVDNPGEKARIIQGMIRVVVDCLKLQIYYDTNFKISDEQIDVIGDLKALITSQARAELYTKHLLMITGLYPIQDIITEIHYEADSTNSVVNSSTFENELLDLSGRIMEEIKIVYQKSGKILLDELYELFYFIAEWLQEFSEDDQYFQDVVLILSPILSIILVQMIQAFYQQNKHLMCLLLYLTMQHFTAMIREYMDLVGGASNKRSTSYLAEDFRSMIDEWQIEQFTGLTTILDNIKLMSFPASNARKANEMIDDQIMMGFLELASELEAAIDATNNGVPLHELDQSIYREPSHGIHLFDRIGVKSKKPLRFPMIRNAQTYAAAMSVIPFEINLSNSMINIDLNNLIDYFFNQEGDDEN